jgi:Cu-Zn family superoxide dismutase
MQKAFVIASVCAAAFGGALAGAPASAETAGAELVGADGASMGTVEMRQGPTGVLISIEASGLTPGEHGLHIHQTGECQGPDFKSAGEHYAPGGSAHGYMSEGGPHAGDLPNITAGEDGTARVDHFTTLISLAEDATNTVFDADGSAVIIHENPDDYADADAAGGRIACGVITPGE